MDRINITNGEWVGVPVSDKMFGANILFDRDRVENGTYDDVISELGVTSVRYPGGSISEWWFDMTTPNATVVYDAGSGNWRDVMPLETYLQFTADAGLGQSLVIPTRTALADGAIGTRDVSDTALDELADFVAALLRGDFGPARIESFEIGNEYWGSGEMTDVEYGRVASSFARVIQQEIDTFRTGEGITASWKEPDIAVQIGQAGAFSPGVGWIQNTNIIAEFDDLEAAAVDVVLAHYYAQNGFEDILAGDWVFNRMERWTEDSRFSDVDFHVTEWNVANRNDENLGLRQAPMLLNMFGLMVERGVDAAWVWPVQQNTRNDLSGNEGEVTLTVAGELFRMLSEQTKGRELAYREITPDWASFTFRSQNETAVFVTSQANSTISLELDLGFLSHAPSQIWTTHLSSDGDNKDPNAPARVTVQSDVVLQEGKVVFDLAPYEVMRITISSGEFQAVLNASNLSDEPPSPESPTIAGTDVGEEIVAVAGNNMLRGESGNDTIRGGDGADTIHGGDGDDVIFGGLTENDLRDLIFAGAGNDWVDGGWGNDEIHGMDGNDTLLGGFGSDTLFGGAGDDVLNGGPGSDVIFGGAGDDFINGGFGHDRVNGGPGADTFFHLGILDHGSDWIQDFTHTEGDVLLFGQAGATGADFQVNVATTEGAGAADVAEAFVIYKLTGQIIWALVNGMANTSINLTVAGSDAVYDLLA